MSKLLVRIFLLVLFTIVPLGLYNYSQDYYGVFKKELSNRYNEPNVRFLKIQHLIDNPTRYKTVLFGSSRAGKILAYKHDSTAYNMYYSEGVPAEFMEDLTLLLDQGVSIKKVYIALDEFSFMINPEKHKDQLLRMRYEPDLINQTASYIQFLIDPPKLGLSKYSIPTDFDVFKSGNPLHFEVDTLIERNKNDHIISSKFKSPKKYYNIRIDKSCEELETIIKLCQQNDVQIQLFFNPVYINTYVQYGFDLIAEIKSKLASKTEFTDFSGPSNITMNPYFFYESNHYRYMIGDSIWMHLSGQRESTFAKPVKSDNIGEILAKEKALWPN
ncbi:MAG: hypothetical protein AAF901_01895 [Bacteroidota bacterium]